MKNKAETQEEVKEWSVKQSILVTEPFQEKKFYLFPDSVVTTQNSDRSIVFISLCGHLHASKIHIYHVKMALWMWFYTHGSQETQNYGSQSNFNSSSFHINCILRQDSYHHAVLENVMCTQKIQIIIAVGTQPYLTSEKMHICCTSFAF